MATVFVWENHYIARSAGDRTWTGHSSLSLTDSFIDTRPLVKDDNDDKKMVVDSSSQPLVNGSDDYVSFWPGRMDSAGPKNVGGNFMLDAWKIGVSFLAASKPSIFADVSLEGYAPDHVIRINNLSVNKMTAKWRTIRSKQGAHYTLLRKNCSTIVAHVLQAANKWHKNDHYLVWTPTNVRDYAMKLGTTMTWSDFIDELETNLFGTTDQLALLRKVKRRSQARGTSGGQAAHP